MKIYVAGSSSELSRAKRMMQLLSAAGFDVVSTWPATIEAVGDANPREATTEQRLGWSRADVEQVRQADLLWLLVSAASVSFGACFEFGIAHERSMHVVASGDTLRSIFTSLADEFADDMEAFAHICKVRDEAKRTAPAQRGK